MSLTGPVAEFNIGLLHYPADDPRSAGFTDNVGRVNAIAERSEGFVWRCLDEPAAMEAEGVSLFDGDPCALCTLSVWETPEALEAFVQRTVHGAFLKRRTDWFRPHEGPSYVIWPVAGGHIPGFREGLEKLATLADEGPSVAAYDFKYMRHRTRQEAE